MSRSETCQICAEIGLKIDLFKLPWNGVVTMTEHKIELTKKELSAEECRNLGVPIGTMWFDPSSKAQNKLITDQLEASRLEREKAAAANLKPAAAQTNPEPFKLKKADTKSSKSRGENPRPSLPANATVYGNAADEPKALAWAKASGFSASEIQTLKSIFQIINAREAGSGGWLPNVIFGAEIGSGAFGAIFKATYNGEPVAVKRISQKSMGVLSTGTVQHTGNTQQLVRNVFLELSVVTCLDHPNIVHFKVLVLSRLRTSAACPASAGRFSM